MRVEADQHIILTVKNLMQHHIGGANRISYDELTRFLYGSTTANNKRKLRAVISAINADPTNRMVICSDRADGGLFMNGSDQEDLERHRQFIAEEEAQARHTLEKTRAMSDKLRLLYPDSSQWRLF